MATLSIYNLARAIRESSLGKSGPELDTLIENTALFLKEKQLLGKSDNLLSMLERLIDKEEKITRGKITAREKLPDKLKKKVEEYIKERYKVEETVLTYEENPKMLGGIKVEIGDEIIDVTLKNKLNKLQNYLIKN